MRLYHSVRKNPIFRRLEMSETMAVQEHLFDATGQLTETTDFGIDAQSVLSGRTPTPPQGVRFNTSFQVEITGPKLKGKIVGTDYWILRADGVGIVNVEAVLTPVEGDRIAYHANGIFTGQQGSAIYQLRENLSFHTSSMKYSWVNRIQCWATGTIDLSTRKIAVKGYAA
jgi:hypothetical protein